jgi:hypothetical protein
MSITFIVSTLLSIITFLYGALALFQVRTDVGVLCAIIVIQCAWMINLFEDIRENTRKG